MAQNNPTSQSSDKPGSPDAKGFLPEPRIGSGMEAAIRTLSAIHDRVVVSSETLSHGISISPAYSATIERLKDPAGALSFSTGLASTGASVGLLIDTSQLTGIREIIESAVHRHIPLTVVLSRPLSAVTDSTMSGADAVLQSVYDAGAPVLSAASMQETVDFIAIARTVSQALLMPVVVTVDGRDSLWSLQTISDVTEAPELKELPPRLETFRNMLFGEERQHQPSWVDTNNPMEIGIPVPESLALKQRIGRFAFLQSEMAELIDTVFQAFGEKYGRTHEWGRFESDPAADVVLVAAGSLVTRLEAVTKEIQSSGLRVSIVGLSLLRPFPASRLARVLSGTARIGVLSASNGIDPNSADLVQMIRAALQSERESTSVKPTRRNRKRADQRTQIVFPILCQDSWQPSTNEVEALCRRILAEPSSTLLMVGARVSSADIRLPEVERVRQQMIAGTVDLSTYEIESTSHSNGSGQSEIFIATKSARDTWRLMDAVARLVSFAGLRNIQALFHGDSDATTHPVIGVVRWKGVESKATGVPKPFILVKGSELFGALPVRQALPQHACLLLVETPDSVAPADTISRFPHWMISRKLSITEIDVTELDIPTIPSELIPEWVLLAALLAKHQAFIDLDPDRLSSTHVLGMASPASTGELVGLVMDRTRIVEQDEIESASGRPPEPETPKEVAYSGRNHVPIADLTRLWQTTGVLYREGRLQDIPADPCLTTGALPARSGSLTQQLLGIKPIPHVITERCTGCGACWTMCPESAFSSNLFTLETLVDEAIRSAEASGTSFLQVPRLRPALIKTMHRLAARDDLHQHETAGALLSEATRQVLEKAGLDDEKRAAAEAEVASIADHISSLRPIRTARFFDGAETLTKGSGKFLGLTIDPFACTTCGLCISSCNDGALERTDTAEASVSVQTEWHQLLDLAIAPPDVPEEVGTAPTRELAPLAMIGRSTDRVFRAGGADVGNVNRTVLRLFLESAQVYAGARHKQLVNRISETIARIDDRMQEQVRSSVEINDFQAFSNALKNATDALGPVSLSELTAGPGSVKTEDSVEGSRDDSIDHLKQLADLREACNDWLERCRVEPGSSANAHMVLVQAMSDRSFGLAGYPINPFAMPCFNSSVDRAGDVTRGLLEGLKQKYKGLADLIGKAEQVVEGVFEGEADRTGSTIGPGPDVGSIVPLVLIVTDHLGPELHHLLASNLPVKVLLMSDGFSPHDPGHTHPDPMLAALSLEHLYVHQTPIMDPVRLLEAFLHAHRFDGPSIMHVYAPDPVRDGLAVDDALALSRMTLETRIFPSLLRIPGSAPDLAGNPVRINDRTTPGDWMLGQERFSNGFTFVPRRDWTSDQIPLHSWLALSDEDRNHSAAYIERSRPDGLTSRYLAGDQVTQFADSVQDSWRTLSASPETVGRSGGSDETDTPEVVKTQPAAADQNSEFKDALSTLKESLYSMSGFADADLTLADWSKKMSGTTDSDEIPGGSSDSDIPSGGRNGNEPGRSE